jgi:DNA-binding transcriptional MerR regulator
MEIPDKIFFKIGEVSELAGVKPYVLRYWETEFSIVPHKSGTGQRLYRRKDIERILLIKRLLYAEGFTIAGARKHLARFARGESETTGELGTTTVEEPLAEQGVELENEQVVESSVHEDTASAPLSAVASPPEVEDAVEAMLSEPTQPLPQAPVDRAWLERMKQEVTLFRELIHGLQALKV